MPSISLRMERDESAAEVTRISDIVRALNFVTRLVVTFVIMDLPALPQQTACAPRMTSPGMSIFICFAFLIFREYSAYRR
ncbi:MAG TPA: hypothetical protein DCO77_05395 [Nitrospiraceae bacterium]|nr:hypothetical protein [Nitrospiraceae bacterium]